jgi:DNA-binding CsgD family transcriptional regulator
MIERSRSVRIDTSVSVAQVEAIAEAAFAVCALPSVATIGWCDHAARAIGALCPDAILGVAIGRLGAGGDLSRVECVGIGGGREGPWRDDVRRRFEPTRDIGWRLAGLSAQKGPVVAHLAGPEGASWPASPSTRCWRELGALDAIVGVSPLSPADPSRVILVEMVLLDGPARFEESHLALLKCALRPLASKAGRAFGVDPAAPGQALTHREQQVLEQLTLGKSVKQIAADLARSPHTVHDHVKSLHRKLNASSRGELIARALGHLETGRRPSARPVAAAG